MNGAGAARRLVCATAVLAGLLLALAGRANAQDLAVLSSVTIDDPTPIVGQTLTALPNDLSLNPAYQWRRCSAVTPRTCVDIPGATAQTYVVSADDVGYELRVRATLAGVTVGSERTDIVPAPPEITAVTISGDAVVGQTLTASAEVAPSADVTYAYRWLRCDASNACEGVGDGATYLVEAVDVGFRLAVRATVTSPTGEDGDRSALTDPVQLAPTITSVTIAGAAVVGQRLTASATATGVPAPAITFQWLRCGPLLPASCDPIENQTGTSYDVVAADAGFRLAVRARAENSAGADTNRSSLSDVVADPPDTGSSFDQVGTPPTLEQTPPAAAIPGLTIGSLRYLRPFPVIRIKGLLVPGGARVTLLRVTAPQGSRIEVRCTRPGCALRRQLVARGRIRALERFLRAGMRITIRVWKPGFIGKHVRIVIREGKPPVRRDACLLPGRRLKPATCPAP